MILITGATGRTGAHAARQLAAKGVPVRALVRNAEKAGALKAAGVEIALGDAGDAVALRAALAGVTAIAIILPNGQRQLELEKGLTDAAVAAGVKRILKVSSMESHASATNPVHRTHWESEQHIRRAGIPWTMVRPSFYMQNFLGCAGTIRAESKFYFPFGKDGAAVMTDSRDVGSFIAHVLSTPGHENRSYDVTSADLLKFTQVAQLFTELLGRKVEYVDQDPSQYRQMLAKFVTNAWHLDAVMGIFREVANGYVAHTTTTFRDVMGREPNSLRAFLSEHIAVFRN
jgi:uncharacterized protein YbjT (DUF2867 family)